MPIKLEESTQYTIGGTPSNRGLLRRFNPMVFLTICSVLFILVIVAALIVFAFLPIFTSTKDDQTRYQVRSDVLTLAYNLPDKESMLAMNRTYEINDLESDKLLFLQKLLQDQLNHKKITKKTSLVIMDAFITHEESPSKSTVFISPVTLDNNNNTIIIITQSDNSTQKNATAQLIISLRLRYALECTKKCQSDMKESIFAKIFRSLELPLDTFQQLFTTNVKFSTKEFLSSSPFPFSETTTSDPCHTRAPSTTLASSVLIAISYEAESLLNRFISTSIESCLACSNELKVSQIGYGNELIFRQIFSQYGGPTIVVFYYTTNRIRSAEIVINEMLPSINVTFPIMFTTEDIFSLPVTFNLCHGLNSIRIYNPNDYTPDFDRIIVY
ncbi:hypothetical protein I4U23_006595 [Adineta vaga]|nr:hypothetical protein I4U23_006595 [Adineta vaga]